MNAALILELLVKSGLIAGAGLALSAALSFRPARDRVDILRGTTVLIAVLPVLMVLAPRLPLAWLAPAPSAPAVPPFVERMTFTLDPVAPVTAEVGLSVPSWALITVIIYALVAALLTGRFLLGVLTLDRWTRAGRRVETGPWAEALSRLGQSRARLVVSDRVEGPLSWGLPPGVVLIGRDSLDRPLQARAVLAHELAHLRRRDWLFLALSRLTISLFWFNPLVWALHARLTALTEDAADAAAVAEVEPGVYARALLDVALDASHPAAHPAALAMGGRTSSLKKRITRIMTARKPSPPRPLALALGIAALAAVATPIAAVELTRREDPPRAPAAPAAPAAPSAPILSQDQALPAPPAPPAPPQALEAPEPPAAPNRVVIREYLNDPEVRRAVEEARVHAAQARAHVDEVRAQTRAAHQAGEHARLAGQHARLEGERARVEGRRMAALARVDAAQARAQAMASAREAQVTAQAAQAQAREAMAQARVHMREGAVDMERGAQQMREEGRRLRDPAYRARVIEENRARGSTVTDRQLIELSRTLPAQADDLSAQAVQMRGQADRED